MGRKSGPMPALDAATVQRIKDEAAKLFWQGPVADALGISRRTMKRWLAAGRQAQKKADAGGPLDEREQLYLSALCSFSQSRAEVQAKCLKAIQDAAADPRHWTAAAWIAERSDPENWGMASLVAEMKRQRKEIDELRKLLEAGAGAAPGMPASATVPFLRTATPEGDGPPAAS